MPRRFPPPWTVEQTPCGFGVLDANGQRNKVDETSGREIAAIGAVLALLAGHARFIEVAWVSIAASLFVLAWAGLERRE